MIKTLGIVDVASRSVMPPASRGVQPLASRRLGDQPLLKWLVRRLSETQRLDQILVLAADERQHQLCRQLTPPNIPVIACNGRDELGRLGEVIACHRPQAVVRVELNSPFLDPVLVERLIVTAANHPDCDYVGYCGTGGRSLVHAHLGLAAEWCRSSALEVANREARDADRRSPTYYICSRPERFQLRLLPLPSQLDRSDLRLAVHSEEDWEHAQEIYEALGPERLDWQRITGLLDQNPKIRERMAMLNLRNQPLAS